MTTRDILSFALVTSNSFPVKSTSVLFWSTQCELCKFCKTQCGVEQLSLSTACTVRELSGTSGACCFEDVDQVRGILNPASVHLQMTGSPFQTAPVHLTLSKKCAYSRAHNAQRVLDSLSSRRVFFAISKCKRFRECPTLNELPTVSVFGDAGA